MTKSMRVAAKAAKISAARLCAAATEASQPQPADTNVSAGCQHQPATPVAGSRSASPREDVDPELVVDYSGESDDATDSKPPVSIPGSPRGDTSSSNVTKRDRGTLSESMYREMFGSYDESDDSPNESRDSDSGGDRKPATPVAGSRSASPREDVDPELVVDYSGESDEASYSKPPVSIPGSPRGDTSSSNVTKRDRGTLSESMYREMFGSYDESDDSPNESKDSDSGGDRKGDVSASTDINARSVGTSVDTIARGVGTSVDTTQEALVRNVLRLAPDRKPWMLPKHLLDRWSGKTNERFPITLFDASKLHGLDASAKNFRTDNDYYIDVFLEHRWYGSHKKREADAFLQSWSAFITNVFNVGKEAWFQRLYASRNKFERRSTSGACYRLHRLSREAGLLCLAWGDPCPGCLSTSSRAPKEAYLLTEPWWRARISSEMREGIATLQSLYERAGRSFSDGPSPSGAPCCTVRQGRERRPSVGPEVPIYPPKADSHATGRDNSSDVPSPSLCFNGFARVTRELRCDVDHERDKRRRLEDIVRQLGFDREKSRAYNAVSNLVRDNKNLKGILESNGYLRRSKKPRTECTDEDVLRKT
ncbi:unnamed protein product [Peronospora effusa]|nr:unnamed protein product [Peronospora effusa]